jgi:acetyl esterase
MSDDPRWDPEMLAIRKRMDAMAAQHPPVLAQEPFDRHRAVNDLLGRVWTEGGPRMADSVDRWVSGHGRRILCRVHRPRTDRPLPVLVWLHGGGWVFASIDSHDRMVREYAEGAGIATVSVDYTLSPEGKFPTALLEATAVIDWIAREGAAWGLDPSRIAIGGDSAGGNLALGTALHLRELGTPKLRGILAAYPVTDCRFDTPSYVEFAEGFGLTTASMQRYWELYLRDASDRINPLAAPLRADPAGLPPTLIQLAEIDVLRSDGELMAEKMEAAGVDVTLETYSGMAHGFMRNTGHAAKSREAVARAAAWLRAHLG